jgi:hypothetical protein
VPYIYSEMQAGVESGVSLLRPMYYYHPEDKEAYRAKYQYYFGESMVVSPIAEPVEPITETVRHKTWLPAGQWFDTALGMLIEGGRWHQETYLLSEVPTFVRPGAVIPGQFGVRRTGDGSVRSMLVTAYPGDNGEYTLYEDDGSTTAYLDGASASILLTNSSDGDLQTVCVHPIRGAYRGMVKNRRLQIRIPIAVPPRDVRIGGDQLSWASDGAQKSWRYDAYGQQIVVDVGGFSVTEGISVIVVHNDSAKMEAIPGLKGLAARLKRICALNGMAVPIASISEGERIGIDAGQAYHRIDLDPTSFTAEMRRLRLLLPALAKEFGALVGPVGRGGAPGQAELLEKARDMAKLVSKQFG